MLDEEIEVALKSGTTEEVIKVFLSKLRGDFTDNFIFYLKTQNAAYVRKMEIEAEMAREANVVN